MILMKLYESHRGYFRAFSDIKNTPLEMRQRQKLRLNPIPSHPRYFNIICQGHTSTKDKHQPAPSDRSRPVKIIHDIQTSLSLTELKNISSIKRILNTHNCFIRPHHWNASEKDITTIGWFLNINPSHQSRDFTKLEIEDKIKSAHQTKKITIPPFRITMNNPSIANHQHSPQKMKTKAYAIEVKSSDKPLLSKLLSHTYSVDKTFIPYYLIKKDKEAFSFAISLQNTFSQVP